jgi:hypothetical protein
MRTLQRWGVTVIPKKAMLKSPLAPKSACEGELRRRRGRPGRAAGGESALAGGAVAQVVACLSFLAGGGFTGRMGVERLAVLLAPVAGQQFVQRPPIARRARAWSSW